MEAIFYLIVLVGCACAVASFLLNLSVTALLVKLTEQGAARDKSDAAAGRKLRGPYQFPNRGLNDIQTPQLPYGQPTQTPTGPPF